jgi:hypothetical protein
MPPSRAPHEEGLSKIFHRILKQAQPVTGVAPFAARPAGVVRAVEVPLRMGHRAIAF